MSFLINKNDAVKICVSDFESEAVKIAVKNLTTDLNKVVGAKCSALGAEIIIGTVGVSDIIEEYITSYDLKVDGVIHKETYLHKIDGDKLIIAGSDRRGTIYGIYEFCENIGVSPWCFFGDVPVKTKEKIELSDDYYKKDYPTVEYRGIFINDEEELDNWVKLNMGEETIGVKTYEKIFELLLRLKANYIWPAMHVNSFNIKPENGALADKMGIVVGTSHCDMLMRSNNREWKPWLKSKGYENVEYDYSKEGRNRDILKEYWRESIEQNKDFEVSYTLGMRGIHDSGFEVRAFKDLTGDELLKAKIELLEMVISDQKQMLGDILDKDTLKTFVPYKEVLNLYDNGLNVPEDLTLIWSNDNYGHIRRYPGEKERKRKGGNGIYYHNSYWSPPCASYLFICSIPLAHTKNELKKAFNEGIQKLWVLNVGAIKPIEPETEFFLRYAWEITKETTTENVDTYMEQWVNKNFSGNHGAECADIFNEFDQIVNTRKVEHMENDVFSLTAYGDEWTDRLNRLKDLYDRTNAVYNEIPNEEKNAFYQLVLMKIHAGYYMNAQYYYADRSKLCYKRGMLNAAQKYTEYSIAFDDEKRKLVEYYNHHLSGGKWNGILTPEKFPPPVNAMHPICMPPIEIPEEGGLVVSVWNDECSIKFVKPAVKWIDIAPSGKESVKYEIDAPAWIELSKTRGISAVEDRIFISVSSSCKKSAGIITVSDLNHGKVTEIPVTVDFADTDCENIADGGVVSVDACSVSGEGWIKIDRLGRSHGALTEAAENGGTLEYKIYLTENSKNAVLEIHRFPSLNSTGQIRVGISVDGGGVIIAESDANDEWRGNWQKNIFNNVDKLYVNLGKLTEGEHKITFTAIDKYFAFSKFAVYTDARRENNTAPSACDARVLTHTADFYKEIILLPRPSVMACKNPTSDTLQITSVTVSDDRYADTICRKKLVQSGCSAFEENNGTVKINAAAVLSDTEFANVKNGEWAHCNSESYGRSSIGMYAEGALETLDAENAPCLNYAVNVGGGEYTVWLLTKITRRGDNYISVSIDGELVSVDKLYCKGKLWRYEAEQIWRWVPAAEISLTEGCHEMGIISRTVGIRFDRIYITKGNEFPPSDLCW